MHSDSQATWAAVWYQHIFGKEEKLCQLTRRDFFALYFAKTKNPFFVQIGANDGKLSDPIYEFTTKYRIRGVAVEPTEVVGLLKKNYEGHPVTCIQAAIGPKSGTLPLWVVKKTSLGDKSSLVMSQKSSFRKDVIKKVIARKYPRGENLDSHLEAISVPSLTFDDLVKGQKIERIDFLQIDTEGYDWEILKSIDLKKFSPEIINLETKHLSNEDRLACERHLTNYGYSFFRYENDTCAVKLK